MLRKITLACFFLLLSFSFGITLSYAEYSAVYSDGSFEIFNIKIKNSSNKMAIFSVSFGNEGEVLFSLKQIDAASGTKESFYNDDATIITPDAKIGAKAYYLKLCYKPEYSAKTMVFALSDWFVNEQSVFGVAFNAADGFGNWKENLQETSKFSKIAMIMSNGDTPKEIAVADSEKIDQAVKLGMKPLLVLSSIFFDENFSLYENYKERFQEYIKKINKNSIWGIYLIDEYDWIAIQHGYSPKKMRTMVNEAIAVVKSVLPNVLTLGVAATTADDFKKKEVLGFPISADWYSEYGFPNFDLIGFDLYWTQFKCGDNSMDNFFIKWDRYEGNLKKFLLPGQRIIIIPGTYETKDSPLSLNEHLQMFNFYKNKQVSDARVGAVICFLWPSVKSESAVGLKDLPNEKKNVWENY